MSRDSWGAGGKGEETERTRTAGGGGQACRAGHLEARQTHPGLVYLALPWQLSASSGRPRPGPAQPVRGCAGGLGEEASLPASRELPEGGRSLGEWEGRRGSWGERGPQGAPLAGLLALHCPLYPSLTVVSVLTLSRGAQTGWLQMYTQVVIPPHCFTVHKPRSRSPSISARGSWGSSQLCRRKEGSVLWSEPAEPSPRIQAPVPSVRSFPPCPTAPPQPEAGDGSHPGEGPCIKTETTLTPPSPFQGTVGCAGLMEGEVPGREHMSTHSSSFSHDLSEPVFHLLKTISGFLTGCVRRGCDRGWRGAKPTVHARPSLSFPPPYLPGIPSSRT